MAAAGVRVRELAWACAGASVLSGVATWRLPPEVGERSLDVWSPLLLALMCCAVLSQARWATAGGVVVLVLLSAYLQLDLVRGPVLITASAAVLLVALGGSRARAAVLGLAWVVSLIPVLSGGWRDILTEISFLAVLVGFPLLLAELVTERQRRGQARREADAARVGEIHARARMELARDLHDGLGHVLSAITLQARAGAEVAGAEQDRDRFALIASVGAEAMTDISSLVGALREDQSDPAPAPALADLERLRSVAGAAGQRVKWNVADDLDEFVAPHVGVVVWRILQEALANARQHAPDQEVEAILTSGDRLELVVRNPLPTSDRSQTVAGAGPVLAASRLARTASQGGWGLVGMRERVEASGGVVDTGVMPNGCWEVRASWPMTSGC